MELSWSVERLALQQPLRISRGSMSERDAVVVELRHGGLVGYGEAVASAYYRQDALAITRALAEIAPQVAALRDPFDLLGLLDEQNERRPKQCGTLAALDAAAHDWIGKTLGLPVHRLLGLDPRRLRPTALTLGITDPETAAAAAREAAARGFPVLKLKVGLPSPDHERALVAAVRAAAPEAELYLDANGGWTPDEAPERIERLLPFGPALVEQPIAPGQIERLAELSARSALPLIADEDAVLPGDVPRLWGAVAGVNIKLNKCGGIRQALRMAHAARAAGLRVMLGCMVSSSLGIAPAAQIAPLADYLDLDGHLLLRRDPWTGLGGAGGQLELAGSPGLGVVRKG
ncbi:MAG TPA: dipeptide epimerase [Roseiflexaceae bacterium]|nr:dipeptide epimerase [Roseiflexaceae bacterium]